MYPIGIENKEVVKWIIEVADKGEANYRTVRLG
jgi:hypothetical protein